MRWDESGGRVSRAYSEWLLIERDQRAFFRLGLRFAREMYDRLWDEAGSEPGDPEGPDQVDSFEAKVDGLWRHDYEWMHSAGVLRDAVTSFEVYLEKAREEVLRHHGHHRQVPEAAPRWHTLEQFFKKLRVEIETDAVREVRSLRHFLTHQRGELRTEELRRRFSRQSDGIPPIVVELHEEDIIASMDALASAVRAIDPSVYEHSWGGARITTLAS